MIVDQGQRSRWSRPLLCSARHPAPPGHDFVSVQVASQSTTGLLEMLVLLFLASNSRVILELGWFSWPGCAHGISLSDE